MQDNNTYNHFSGKTVKLADNFDNSNNPVTKTAGSDGHEFMGIFDGNSKTLNANISGSTGGEAVFYRINGATIKNLTLSGSITGGQHCGALVGFADGTNIIENVNVTANVSLDGSISANKAHHGGVIGHALSSNTTLRGVVYSGTISSTTASTYVYVGGLVGWADSATITIENSIFDGTYNGGTLFHPILCKTGNKTVIGTFTNVYYTATPTANNLNYYLANAGKNAYTITAGDNVELAMSGTPTVYSVSGITAYKNNSGLKYGNTFYAGNGDSVTLTLTHDTPTGYTFTGYTASAGTIDGTALTMPESDVVINAVDAVNTYTVTWVDGDGNSTTDTVAYGTVPTAPQNPTKTGNAQYSYTFSGWDKDITAVTGDVTYTAQFTASVNKYTVRWVNYDGTELEKDENVEYGTTPEYNGETPAKTGNAQYSYIFSGWGEVTAVTGNITYTAQFTESVNEYTVTWIDGNGSATTDSVAYGETPVYSGDTPTKAEDDFYTYEFSGWDKEISAVTGNTTYTAQFTANPKNFTVTWVDGNGSTLKTDSVAYGETPVYSGDTPTKAEDDFYTYTFSGWDKEITAVTGNVTYTAQFKETPKCIGGVTVCDGTDTHYNVPYKFDQNSDYTGTEQIYPSTMLTNLTGRKLYSLTFYSSDNYVVEVNGMQVYLAEVDNTTFTSWIDIPENAVKVFDSNYTFGSGANAIEFDTPYTYNGGNLLVIIQNTANGTDSPLLKRFYAENYGQSASWCKYSTYDGYSVSYLAKCTFSYAYTEKYTVTWKDADGTVLETDTNVMPLTMPELPLTMPEYNGATPAKAPTNYYTYTFTGWDKELAPVTEDITYWAQFDRQDRYFNITVEQSEGGTIEYEVIVGRDKPFYGDGVSVYVTPNDGYAVKSVYLDGDIFEKDEYGDYFFHMPADDVVITAEFEKLTYTVTWKDADGNTIRTDENVEYGTTLTAPTNLTKAETEFYTYEFSGWDKEITAVTGNVTYTARFKETPKCMGGVTVCDSTDTNYDVPYLSNWNFASVGSEQIYPSTMLAGLTGKKLYSLTFYSSDDVETDVKGMQVYLAEVDYTAVNDSWIDIPENAVKVFDSDYDFGSGANVIEFDTPYTYNGGNLMVIIQNTSSGTNYSEKRFYVQDQSQNTAWYKYSIYDGYSESSLAKCTFGYAYTEKYTVTWKDADGTVLETDTNVMPLTMPESIPTPSHLTRTTETPLHRRFVQTAMQNTMNRKKTVMYLQGGILTIQCTILMKMSQRILALQHTGLTVPLLKTLQSVRYSIRAML